MGVRFRNGPGIQRQFQLVGLQMSELRREWLDKVGEFIAKEAKIRAPIDTGDLEGAITSKITSEKTVSVYVDEDKLNLEDHQDYDYSVKMHEGTYNLGTRSRIKQEHYPNVTVGPKYLENAANDNKAMLRAMAEKIFKELSK